MTTLGAPSLDFIERLYADFIRDPESVPIEWQRYFSASSNGAANGHEPRFSPSFRPASIFHLPGSWQRAPTGAGDSLLKNRLDQLSHNFRVYGHLAARIDPLGQQRPSPPELEPESCGIDESDMERSMSGLTDGSDETTTVRDVVRRSREIYCGSVGAQFMHITDAAMRNWVRGKMEETEKSMALSSGEKRRILGQLTSAEAFEQFIRRKFIGAKSFSLEGSEALIPLLDAILERAGEQETEEIVLGMAHRGRLNVLANILGKSLRQIFREFATDTQGKDAQGDVKYHLGHSGDRQTASGRRVHLSLCFNPSHLEFINPVVLGRVRAKQDRSENRRCLAALIHGDAAMAGEGIMQESLNLMSLPGYSVGGAVHIVINNQIGFTTSPAEGRSSVYATDVALMLQVPIFHVNGGDPEAVVRIARMAMDFRQEFQRDVFIDMYCYRKLGHNESDEPTYSQPSLYKSIRQQKGVREDYARHLVESGIIRQDEAETMTRDCFAHLEEAFSGAEDNTDQPAGQKSAGVWKGYFGGREKEAEEVETGMDKGRLSELLEIQTHFPPDFHPHPKIQKGVGIRQSMARGEHLLDWSAAEALALAGVAVDGGRVRLSGQDSARGTFSQRHAVLYDYDDGHPFVPLQHLQDGQGPVEIWNSPLSEAGVLGFEYGYSLDCPDGLILWEAQFGDFVNAAQVIVDQFLACAEEKWRRLSGLVLLLPHGLEGMGPEHSSARLERFLALAAGDNLQVVYPTTPAQYFHCLRRQFLRHWRKPLVVMTPKGLLRNPSAVSRLEDCASGGFQRVIPDLQQIESPERILLCSGKIYFELEAFREKNPPGRVAVIRIEELYPFPLEPLVAAMKKYRDGTPVCWVQEEPLNMGAWRYLRALAGEKLLGKFPLSVIGRAENASPATGSATRHKEEQLQLLEQAIVAYNFKSQTKEKGNL